MKRTTILVILAALLVARLVAYAHAGSCRYSSTYGETSVSCSDGYHSRTGMRTRQWGWPNGGFKRYDDQPPAWTQERR